MNYHVAERPAPLARIHGDKSYGYREAWQHKRIVAPWSGNYFQRGYPWRDSDLLVALWHHQPQECIAIRSSSQAIPRWRCRRNNPGRGHARGTCNDQGEWLTDCLVEDRRTEWARSTHCRSTKRVSQCTDGEEWGPRKHSRDDTGSDVPGQQELMPQISKGTSGRYVRSTCAAMVPYAWCEPHLICQWIRSFCRDLGSTGESLESRCRLKSGRNMVWGRP